MSNEKSFLELKLSEDNTNIELCKEDKVEFRIPAPFMYDAKGVRSDDVYYELEPSENGKYVFTVVADADWINDEKREMPVTIDPQINVDGLISFEIKQQSGQVNYNSSYEQTDVFCLYLRPRSTWIELQLSLKQVSFNK